MVANAILLAIALMLAIGFALMDQLKFLAPARSFLFREYGWALAIFFGALFLNFFAGAFVIIRKFFLKDTGRKLRKGDVLIDSPTEVIMGSGPAIASLSIGTKTIQKMRIRVIPFIFLLYIIAFLDRSNIAFAALTMNKELGITSQQFGLLAGIFFREDLPYLERSGPLGVRCAIRANILAKHRGLQKGFTFTFVATVFVSVRHVF